uniref:Uncharacterized protein n=1 Tax=Rhizophagus irregularis (strain DAOM 181602 / DAOM 197198 / MUCL 43194) TaxID=747089 RepID=U9TXX7_RHIID
MPKLMLKMEPIQPKPSLPPNVIEELKIQLNDIAQQLKKVSWMEYFITDHEYCIRKLKSMLNYDGPPDNTSRLLSKQCWLGQLSSKH